jgi:hypothetical protein
MLKNWKYIILNGWSFMRVIRLGLAAFVILESFRTYDVLFGVIGFVLLMQAVFNVACCGSSVCQTSLNNNEDNKTEVLYEEVKIKNDHGNIQRNN